MSLDWRIEPGLESVAVGFERHGLEDDVGEEGVAGEEHDDPEDESETAQDQGDETAVAGAPLETAAWRTSIITSL